MQVRPLVGPMSVLGDETVYELALGAQTLISAHEVNTVIADVIARREIQ